MTRRLSLLSASIAASSALTLCLAAAAQPSRAAEAGVVDVQVLGLRNDRGVLRVALFNSAAAWGDDRGLGRPGNSPGGHALRTLAAPIASGTAKFSFTGLPYGTYALKAFHDEDRSGRFYTGIFGIPKVEVVFSNNVPIRRGAASFAQASFPVNQPYTSLVLRAQRI